MEKKSDYDAIVIGAGPNGLSAAIVLAQQGYRVLVCEASSTIGGGARTKEVTLPGFQHDICSAIHPLGYSSPFFRSLPLEKYGVEWIHPPAALAHPFDDGSVALVERSIEATSETLNQVDRAAYRHLLEPMVVHGDQIVEAFLGPLRPQSLRHPLALTPFALSALQSARGLAHRRFQGVRAQALLAGVAAHSFLPLEQIVSAAAGLMLLVTGHTCGWPFPRGGSQRLVDALAAYLADLGGKVLVNTEVQNIDDLPPARAYLFDVTPRQLLQIAGERFPAGYTKTLQRYRYGPGACKVDFALDGPIPWSAQECNLAATVHLGGTLEEIAISERAIWQGKIADRPYVLVAQQSLFDATRAPEGKHTAWAYCHVPHGSSVDMTDRIEAQIERFAPGFRQRILARNTLTAMDLEQYNANYIGGDISGGVLDLKQLFTRPSWRLFSTPYTTPASDIFLCSSSTPPGGGVHGMCGYFAAQAVLRTFARQSS